MNSFNRMFANTVPGKSNNRIPPLVLSCSHFQLLEGSFQRKRTILRPLERLQTCTSVAQWLRTDWPGLSLGNTISHGATGPSLHSHAACVGWPTSPMTSSKHTISLLPCKTAAPSPAPRHLTWHPKRISPALLALCPTAANACNFCANEGRRL